MSNNDLMNTHLANSRASNALYAAMMVFRCCGYHLIAEGNSSPCLNFGQENSFFFLSKRKAQSEMLGIVCFELGNLKTLLSQRDSFYLQEHKHGLLETAAKIKHCFCVLSDVHKSLDSFGLRGT